MSNETNKTLSQLRLLVQSKKWIQAGILVGSLKGEEQITGGEYLSEAALGFGGLIVEATELARDAWYVDLSIEAQRWGYKTTWSREAKNPEAYEHGWLVLYELQTIYPFAQFRDAEGEDITRRLLVTRRLEKGLSRMQTAGVSLETAVARLQMLQESGLDLLDAIQTLESVRSLQEEGDKQ